MVEAPSILLKPIGQRRTPRGHFLIPQRGLRWIGAEGRVVGVGYSEQLLTAVQFDGICVMSWIDRPIVCESSDKCWCVRSETRIVVVAVIDAPRV